jgi:hypothetical protein
MITISEGKINGDIKEKPSPYTSNFSLTRIDEIGTTSDKITGRAGLERRKVPSKIFSSLGQHAACGGPADVSRAKLLKKFDQNV